MTEPKLNYIGPLPQALTYDRKVPLWRRIPIGFLMVVALPTLVAAVYFLLIASPLYVSEARFIVRSAGHSPSAFGVALQGVGLSSGQTDAFAVHEYITSSDGLRDLQRRFDVAKVLNRPGADIF